MALVSGLLISVGFGAVIALAWAVPAGIAGGEGYRDAIFLKQTEGRLVNSFAHRMSWWWYLQRLPLLLLPWLLWLPLWRGGRLRCLDLGLRFCLSWLVPVFIAFSLISGKRLHYLLPLLPGVALMIARGVDAVGNFAWGKGQRVFAAAIGIISIILIGLPYLNDDWQELSKLSPFWGGTLALGAVALWFGKANTSVESAFNMCAGAVVLSLVLATGFFSLRGARYDTTAPGRKIAALLAQNKAVVFVREYHGQYNFSG